MLVQYKNLHMSQKLQAEYNMYVINFLGAFA